MSRPRYPNLHLQLTGGNPLVWISEVRHALRRIGVQRDEIQRFSAAALTAERTESVREVCALWANLIG